MKELKFENEYLKDECFSNEKYSKIMSISSTFIGCKFEGITAKDISFGAGMNESVYEGCSFDNSSFNSTAIGFARFIDCTFKNVKIKEFFGVQASFINCSFSGEIKKGKFNGKFNDLSGRIYLNDIYGNDFSGANLIDVGFDDVDLFKQEFPDCRRFRIIPDLKDFLSKKREEVKSLEDEKLSQEIIKTISIIEMASEGGNNQHFMDIDVFPKKLIDAAKWIFEDDKYNKV